MISSENLKSIDELDFIDTVMQNTCEIAVLSPTAIYQFMLRFVYYCRSYSFLVARLAAVIGSSSLFRDPFAPFSHHAERSMDVAASVLKAGIEEFRDPKIRVSHRTMSYGLLDRLAEYAGLSEMETQRIAQSQNWLHVILQKVEEGYSANPQNLSSMVKAMGFHVGAETVGARESAIIHQVIFSQQKDKELGRFLRQHKLIFDGRQISPNYWVAVHGTEHSIGVEADHAEDAVKALNQVVQYTQATESQVIAWADEGFSHFNQTQLAFFQSLYTELQSKLQLQNALTVMK